MDNPAESPVPPDFFEVVDDPAFAALDADAKRSVLRETRQLWRRYLDRAGKLADGAEVVDRHAFAAAKEAGVELEPGLFAGLGQDVVKGINSVRTAHNVSGTEDTEDLVKLQEYERTHPGSLAAEDLARDLGDGTGLWAAIKKNPAGFVSTTVHGAANSLPGSVLAAGAGMAAGAGATAATGNPAIGLGAAAGAAGGVSEWQEGGNRYLQKLAEAGAPMADPDLLRAWLRENRAKADQLKFDAAIEALPTATLDAASAGLPALGLGERVAGKVTAKVTGTTGKVLGKAAEYGVEQGMQGALGAAGSAGSDLVAGEGVDTMGALQEALGEFISPMELLGPAAKLGRRLRGVPETTTSPSPVKMPETQVPEREIERPAPEIEGREPGVRREIERPAPEIDDLLGDGDIARRREAAAAQEARAAKLADLRARRGDLWREALRERADGIRERGGEGDGFLSAVEQELGRLAQAQEGDRRALNPTDLAAVVRRVLPEGADEDAIGILATELYGADATTSRANIAAALDTVRAERTRAAEADTPLREARLEREAQARLERMAAEQARARAEAALRAEHDAELARLDAARVTTEGEPDWNRLSDDEVGALAYAETGDSIPGTLAPTLAEARRRHEANPDHDGAPFTPASPVLREWRAAAEAEMNRRAAEADAGPSLRDLLLAGKLQLPTESATYAGELRALRESFTPAERLRIFRKVPDGAAGDTALERLAERLTVDDGFGFLQSSGADLLDAVSRSARGEHLRPDWREGGVRYSRNREPAVHLNTGRTVDAATSARMMPSYETQTRADLAVAETALRQVDGLRAGESLVPLEMPRSGDSGVPAEQILAARELAGKFGRRIVLFQGPEGFANGFFNPAQPDVLFLNADATAPHLAVLGHELMHAMESEAPALAAAVRKELETYAKHFSVYEAYAKRDGYKAPEIRSEFSADVMGDAFLRPGFLDHLATKRPAVFTHFIAYAREFIAATLRRLNDLNPLRERKTAQAFGTPAFLQDIRSVDKLMANALAEWHAARAEGRAPDITGLVSEDMRPFKYESMRARQEIGFSRRAKRFEDIKKGTPIDEVRDLLMKVSAPYPLPKFTETNKAAVLQQIERLLLDHPVIKAGDGSSILLANPENGSLSERAKHLAGGSKHVYNPQRAASVPAVPETLKKFHLRAFNGITGNLMYLRQYLDGLHVVIVNEKGRMVGQEFVDGALISQYKQDDRHFGVPVVDAIGEKWAAGLDEIKAGNKSDTARPSPADKRPAESGERGTPPSSTATPESQAGDGVKFSRRKTAADALPLPLPLPESEPDAARRAVAEAPAVVTAEAALDRAKAAMAALAPQSKEWRRARADVKVARKALTAARAATPEMLALEAKYKRQLAVSGAIYKKRAAAEKALAQGDADPAKQDEVLRLEDERKRAVAAQRETAAEMARLRGEALKLEATDDIPGVPATPEPELAPAPVRRANWAVEEFDAAAWAAQLDAATTVAEVPPNDHFRKLGDEQRNDLIAALTTLADAKPDMPARALLDRMTSNLRGLNRPVVREPAPVTPEETEAERRMAAGIEAFRRREAKREGLRGGGDLLDELRAEAQGAGVPDDGPVETDGAARTAHLAATPAEPEYAEPSAEDAEALRALDSVVPPTGEDPLSARVRAEEATREARERDRAAADNPPPPKSPADLRGGEPEYARRPGKTNLLYGHTTKTEEGWKKVAGGLKDYVRGFVSVVPEIPADAQHLKGITHGYKALIRGQEVAVHNATERVKHIVAPIMALDTPTDPAGKAALADIRAQQGRIEARLRDTGKTRPAVPEILKLTLELRDWQTKAERVIERMADKPLVVFENFIFWRDLLHRSATLQRKDGTPITLPFGINPEEVREEAEKWAERVKAHPQRAAILEAIARHEEAALGTWADLRKRGLIADTVAQKALADAEERLTRAEKNEARLVALVGARGPMWKLHDGNLRKLRHVLPRLAEAVAEARAKVAVDFSDGPWNGGRAYFPHILPETHSGRLDRVARTAAGDFRGYLTQPVGSRKAIETDYIKAMTLHLAAVEADNLHQDVVRREWAPYDRTAALEAEREELREQGKDVPELEVLASARGLVAYTPDNGLQLAMMPTIDRVALGRAIGRVLDAGPLAPQLEALAKQGVRISPEFIGEQLAVTGKKVWWVAPEVKSALEGIEKQEKEKDEPVLQALEWVNRHWKKYVLFFPHNYIRYEFNNTVADTGKLFAVDPAAFKEMWAAKDEVRRFFAGEQVDADTAAAFRLGVFDTPTVKEVEDLRDLPAFDDKLKTPTRAALDKALGIMGKDWHKFSRFREATYRLAKYRADLKRLRAGETPVYGGAYWKDIEAIGDSEPGAGDKHVRRAAAISLATMNDAAAVSRSGAQLRRYLVPFWSFTENNLRYHLNLGRNLWDMTRHGETSAAEAAMLGARATASLTARAAVAIATRAVLPLAMLALYNASVGGEDELSDEDRRRLHLNLGRDANGRVRVLYLENDFAQFLRWFGGMRALGNLQDVAAGRATLAQAASDWASWGGAPKDFVQTVASVGPIPRMAALATVDREIGMDILEPRTVHGKDKVWSLVKEAVGPAPADLLRSALDRDYYSAASFGDWFQQVALQIRRRDPESWAYYKVREKAEAFLEERTGRDTERGTHSSPDQVALRSFRRAIFRGDIPAALGLYDRLLKYGYTAERFKASLRAHDPLGSLPKEDGTRRAFVEQLTDHERKELDRAYLYADRIRELEGKERRLFPHEAKGNPALAAERAERFAADPQRRAALRDLLEQQAREDEDERKLDAAALQRKALRRAR